MGIDRRQFLGGLLASGMGGAEFALASSAPAGLISAAKTDAGFAAVQMDTAGRMVQSVPLPARGHDIALSQSSRRAVVFARRPGNFALALDLRDARPAFQFTSPTDRHFYGHGCFSVDDKLLFAAENDFEAERGCLGIYDARDDFRRVGEYDGYGIGLHEIVLLSDRKTIACAVGGIATHPDYPRQKLNLPDMTPSLAYLDSHTGDLVEQVFMPPDLQRLSLRHIVEGPDRTVWFCGQYEGGAQDVVAVVGYHERGRPLRFISLPKTLMDRSRNYAGSIAANRDRSRIAVSFPRGNFLIIVDSRTKKLVDLLKSDDICGVAGVGEDFLASNGEGELLRRDGTVMAADRLAWDNHLRAF